MPNSTGDRCAGNLDLLGGPGMGSSSEVMFSGSNRAGFEDVTWFAVAGKTYEVRVLPSSIDIPGTDYQGCAEYTAAAGAPFCQAPPPPPPPPAVDATFFTTTCTPPDGNIQRQVDGAGKMPSLIPSNHDARFAIHVKRKADKYGNLKLRGKVRFTDDSLVQFRSRNVGCASFNDATKSVEVHGIGSTRPPNQQDPPVCYRAVATDNGDPGKGKDRFEIEIFDFNQSNNTCSGVASYANNAVITDGNIRYRTQPDQKDDQGEDD